MKHVSQSAQDVYRDAFANLRKAGTSKENLVVRIDEATRLKLQIIAAASGDYPTAIARKLIEDHVNALLPDDDDDASALIESEGK